MIATLRQRIERLLILNYGNPGLDDVASGLMFEVLSDLEEIHLRSKYGMCTACRERFPCRTLTILSEAAGESVTAIQAAA